MMNTQKVNKILFLVDHLSVGGAQEHMYQLCRHLAGEGIEMVVCALHSGGRYKTSFENLGIAVKVLSPRRHPGYLPMILFRLIQLMVKERFSVMHTFLQASFLLGTPLSKILGVPSVHTILSIPGALDWWYRPTLHAYAPLLDLIIVPLLGKSPNPDEIYSRAKIKIVPVAIDLSPYVDLQAQASTFPLPKALAHAKPIMMVVGRLHQIKGIEYGIRAMPQILEALPSAKFVIIGEGPEADALKELSRQLGVASAVVFTGYQKSLLPWYAYADIFLRSSTAEGVNLVTMQAMAAGIPVIGFQNETPTEILKHNQNGILVPPKNVDALARELIRLAVDEARQIELAKKGVETIANLYNLEAVIHFHQQMYTHHSKEDLMALEDMRIEQ